MLGITRIVAFDNERKHLDALVQGISGAGAHCLGFKFTGDTEAMGVIPCPHVRVVFFDLNMVDTAPPSNFSQHYSNIGSLLGLLKPNGPYILILWTHYDDRVDELREFLDKRLTAAPKPFSVTALAKDKYIDGDGAIIDIDQLVKATQKVMDDSPALATLADWEKRVLVAASDTLSSVTMLGSPHKTSVQQQQDIPRLMAKMSIASAGQDNVASNPFRALSDALLPVLADHVSASMSQADMPDVWKAVLGTSKDTPTIEATEAAQLNWAIHFAQDIGSNKGAERGAVIPLDALLPIEGFQETFDIGASQASEKQFRCKEYQDDSPKFHWVLVQAQAACDYAQGQPGPLPFYLGIDIDNSVSVGGSKPSALWTSAVFETGGTLRQLQVNARFQVSLTTQKAKELKPLYRLREQILGDLIQHIHAYGARPGMMSF